MKHKLCGTRGENIRKRTLGKATEAQEQGNNRQLTGGHNFHKMVQQRGAHDVKHMG
jgi:hypothetical protein